MPRDSECKRNWSISQVREQHQNLVFMDFRNYILVFMYQACSHRHENIFALLLISAMTASSLIHCVVRFGFKQSYEFLWRLGGLPSIPLSRSESDLRIQYIYNQKLLDARRQYTTLLKLFPHNFFTHGNR
uniref:Uncharacterized protein n=1 Tax=Glossina palpalis gambiensis TaxID=67801 RepID=A0A1B0BTC0_9MUSC